MAALPRIDRDRCTGCGDCITVCPTAALGWVAGKAALVSPAACTLCAVPGPGQACEEVCPVYAIELPYFIVKFAPGKDAVP